MASYTYKQLIKQAKTCQTNVKSKYKLDMTDKWSYYFAKAILNPKKDIKKISFGDNPKPTQDKIKTKATKAEYIQLAKDLVAFVEGPKKRLPNYLTFKGKKVAPRLLTYDFAKVLVKYDAKGKFQSEVVIANSVFTKPKTTTTTTKTTTNTSTAKKTTTTSKLKDYLTNQGCSGMGQCTGYYCGCNSLQQCFYRLTGIKVEEKTIASVAGTTTSGTDHQGLNTAVAWFNKKYNKNVKITWYNFSDLGKNDSERWSKLSSLIKKGAVFCHILYRNKWGHYEVPKSVGDSSLKILNSLGDQCGSGTYCGYIETRSKSDQRSYINGISQKSVAVLTV